jgi:hypothetical protein
LVTAGTAVGVGTAVPRATRLLADDGWVMEGEEAIGVGGTGRPGRGRFNACPGPHRPQGTRLG